MLAASEPVTIHESPATASKRQPWKPNGDAHLIYHWVKMEGKSQGWVASAFNISQPTVSRIVQRYERWQAHAKEREDGRLDPAERLRAQRWLTFERNELILTSCLRIAHEVEGFVDSSKSTVSRPTNHWSQQKELRSVHFTIDRTGMTARFLRLAFKINMEQLKLAELTQPPLPQALSEEELAEEERQAAADDAELAEAHRRTEERVRAEMDEHRKERQRDLEKAGQREGEKEGQDDSAPDLVTRVPPGNAVPRGSSLADPPPRPEPRGGGFPGGSPGTSRPAETSESTTDQSPTHHSSSVNNLNNLHTENPSEIVTTAGEPCSCTQHGDVTKNSPDPCITDDGPHRWPEDDDVLAASHAPAPLAARS